MVLLLFVAALLAKRTASRIATGKRDTTLQPVAPVLAESLQWTRVAHATRGSARAWHGTLWPHEKPACVLPPLELALEVDPTRLLPRLCRPANTTEAKLIEYCKHLLCLHGGLDRAPLSPWTAYACAPSPPCTFGRTARIACGARRTRDLRTTLAINHKNGGVQNNVTRQ